MSDVNIVVPSHAFDETGTLPENLILNEQRILEARSVRAVIPRYGSFFADSFVMRDANGAVVPKTKYQQALYSDILSAKVGQDVIGGVIITDATVPSPVYIDYRCVGGPWGASNEVILDLFKKLQVDSRPVSWGNLLGKPDGYNPAHHFQDIGDLYGAEYFVAALDRLSQAYMFGDAASHDEIWRRMDEIRALAADSTSSTLTALKSYVDNALAPLNAQFAQLDARITNVRTELLAADATIGQRITSVQSTLQTNINTVGTQVTNLQSTLQAADTALGNRITAVEQSLATNVDTLTKSIAQVRTDFLAGDATLKARIDALSSYGDVSGLIDTKIASARTEWQTADNTINTRITSVQGTLQASINSVDSSLGSHMNNYNNPHRTNYNDVGSYSIQRVDIKEADIYIILNYLSSRVGILENKVG